MSEPAGHPSSAVERARKVQEVISRAIDGRLKSYHLAKIPGFQTRRSGASGGRRTRERAFHLEGNISSIQILEQFFNFCALVLELADTRQVHPSVSDEILAQGRH